MSAVFPSRLFVVHNFGLVFVFLVGVGLFVVVFGFGGLGFGCRVRCLLGRVLLL